MAVRRGVVLVLVLIILAVGLSAAGLLFMGMAVGRPPSISSNSTLLVDVSGDLLETEPGGVLGQFLEGPPTVRSVVDALRKASVDVVFERHHSPDGHRRPLGEGAGGA